MALDKQLNKNMAGGRMVKKIADPRSRRHSALEIFGLFKHWFTLILFALLNKIVKMFMII